MWQTARYRASICDVMTASLQILFLVLHDAYGLPASWYLNCHTTPLCGNGEVLRDPQITAVKKIIIHHIDPK